MAGFRTFATGEVLTAANVNDFLMKQSVMVFADAATRTSALGAEVVEGMLTFNKDTQSLEVFDGTDFVGVGGAVKEKRVDAFTGSGTFTVPAGVTYAIAHVMGGGGGSGVTQGSNGADSEVQFAAGTVIGPGATATQGRGSPAGRLAGRNGLGENSQTTESSAAGQGGFGGGVKNVFVVAGSVVTPGEVVDVIVGAGGAAGNNGQPGGSGYVFIEFQEEA